MHRKNTVAQDFALTFAGAWHHLEGRLDRSLSAVRGISLAEFRMLKALGDAPMGMASRVDLAKAVGLTPSGVSSLSGSNHCSTKSIC